MIEGLETVGTPELLEELFSRFERAMFVADQPSRQANDHATPVVHVMGSTIELLGLSDYARRFALALYRNVEVQT